MLSSRHVTPPLRYDCPPAATLAGMTCGQVYRRGFLDTIFFIFEIYCVVSVSSLLTRGLEMTKKMIHWFHNFYLDLSGQQRDFLLSKTPLLRGVFSLSVG
mmetsp:Transcript_30824/g.73433  ORF Transcript_30824/g.73433 Transcript_30824/m.73433 type:complete len:100 (-) Transcript_30824:436-735(-)